MILVCIHAYDSVKVLSPLLFAECVDSQLDVFEGVFQMRQSRNVFEVQRRFDVGVRLGGMRFPVVHSVSPIPFSQSPRSITVISSGQQQTANEPWFQ